MEITCVHWVTKLPVNGAKAKIRDDANTGRIKIMQLCPGCGNILTINDVGIEGEGPENNTIFYCPSCHGIVEVAMEDVDL